MAASLVIAPRRSLGHEGARHPPRSNKLNNTAIDSAAFRQVLGHYPTGVAAITALGADGAPLVLVVGTFTSVSLDPPLVGFLPDRRSATWPLIAATGGFAVNVLASDQGDLCRQLASPGDKFADVSWHLSAQGHPVIEGVVATVECRIHSVTDAGDHVFVLGLVEALEVKRGADPLIFHRGRYGGFAEAL